jgi:hypothetical protein
LPLPQGWEKRVSKSKGREYYYNLETNTTRWDHPLTPHQDQEQQKQQEQQKHDGGSGRKKKATMPSRTFEPST